MQGAIGREQQLRNRRQGGGEGRPLNQTIGPPPGPGQSGQPAIGLHTPYPVHGIEEVRLIRRREREYASLKRLGLGRSLALFHFQWRLCRAQRSYPALLPHQRRQHRAQ